MEQFQIEALVIDDSFIQYCLGTDDTEVAYWESIIELHPDAHPVFMEARRLVCALNTALRADDLPSISYMPAVWERVPMRRWLTYVAVFMSVVLVTGLLCHYRSSRNGRNTLGNLAQATSGKIVITTANKERKTFVLKDGTRITMNVGSSITLDKDFGVDGRDVFLDGEAMFDIAKKPGLPFTVHTPFYAVKVLGTVFNVKAYRNDSSSETDLLRGKVEILLQDHKKLELSPKSKLVFDIVTRQCKRTGVALVDSVFSVQSITTTGSDDNNAETGWTHGRLEINNETFGQLKGKLERWYDVDIHFADPQVMDYAFTATFEKEPLERMLQALRASYPFTYTIHGKIVTISK
ncbi:FecR family protein [Chitinophaga costaii]|uniref:FecR family protein n=1 Tax=Chitinophaga costaii TaxID=1335309 RepID=A0A1C3Z2E8_9BACT|nr:FecR domain-containing protein [Chitinophaga costaii]PUZ30203.1 DUF4974 domain-containing protein [Chitinophaga costaii]SCB76526.1 FecR family protein [Chitinophaga costaii]